MRRLAGLLMLVFALLGCGCTRLGDRELFRHQDAPPIDAPAPDGGVDAQPVASR